MGLFAKPEYQFVPMNYRIMETDGILLLEAYGEVLGQMKYCSILYNVKTSSYDMYDDGRFDKLMEALQSRQGKQRIEVLIKIKRGKPVDFKIDLEHLAATVGNADILNLERAGWGLNDKPDPDFGPVGFC
ncbi:MAG: hypothetical protein IIZ82_00270 [Clostridia bacterium]|nr:hypothetical protein [Clostridia bacterium]